MITRLMTLCLGASCVAFAAAADLTPVESEDLSVPSGQPVEFYENLMDRPAMGLTARFRFVAPELRARLSQMSYEELEADLSYLCQSYALPRLSQPKPVMVVISLSEQATEFGAPSEDIPQVFEAYRPVVTPAGEVCAWEAF
jgi:hypothetical protein